MIKGYKIRLYPTKEQEALLWKHIGSCRFIWNYMLSYQEQLYAQGKRHLSAYDMINYLKPLKNDGEHKWLYEVSNTSLQIVCQDLDKTYKEFFKGSQGFPKYKSHKRSKTNFPISSECLYFSNGKVAIQKIGKLKYRTDFILPQGKGSKFINPRISYTAGKWMLSFSMRCKNQVPTLTNKSMGIDLGIKSQAVVAFGEEEIVFPNINKSKRMRQLYKKLIYIQHDISRKYEVSKCRTGRYEKTNNIVKAENKLRKVYRRIVNIRSNYIHQITHELISKLPYRVVMEDLNVSGMMKNKCLAKAISEQNFYEFTRQMRYKCEWNGIEFIQADRFYPSSKTCSCCGKIKHDLKLSDRIFTCECGLSIDRDYNAAVNLSRYMV